MKENQKINWEDLQTSFSSKSRVMSFPTISISNKVGAITFNSKFLRNALPQIKGKKSMRLYYSKNNNAIVFKFINAQLDHDFKFNVNVDAARGFTTFAKSFFKFHKIDLGKYYGRYAMELIDISGMGKSWAAFLDKKIQ